MQITMRTNVLGLMAHRNYMSHQRSMARSMQRLSTGYRINSAADDAAGLAISQRMRGQIAGLKMASRNAQNAVSLLQTAEGGLNEVHAILHRMKALAVQAANGTLGDDDRQNIQYEYEALLEEIDRIIGATEFNGMSVLDNGDFEFQIGANGTADNTLSVRIGALYTHLLGDPENGGSLRDTDILTRSNADKALEIIDMATKQVSSQRAKIGANINRLGHTISALDTMAENLTAAESTIRDADMATEMMNYMRASILMQAAQFVMAHSMSMQQMILQLLESL